MEKTINENEKEIKAKQALEYRQTINVLQMRINYLREIVESKNETIEVLKRASATLEELEKTKKQ